MFNIISLVSAVQGNELYLHEINNNITNFDVHNVFNQSDILNL